VRHEAASDQWHTSQDGLEHAVFDRLAALEGRYLDVAVIADDGTIELVARGHLAHAFLYDENDLDTALVIVSDMCATEIAMRAARFIGTALDDDGVTMRFEGRDVRLSLVPPPSRCPT
jgi:hypothetical protein